MEQLRSNLTNKKVFFTILHSNLFLQNYKREKGVNKMRNKKNWL